MRSFRQGKGCAGDEPTVSHYIQIDQSLPRLPFLQIVTIYHPAMTDLGLKEENVLDWGAPAFVLGTLPRSNGSIQHSSPATYEIRYLKHVEAGKKLLFRF